MAPKIQLLLLRTAGLAVVLKAEPEPEAGSKESERNAPKAVEQREKACCGVLTCKESFALGRWFPEIGRVCKASQLRNRSISQK